MLSGCNAVSPAAGASGAAPAGDGGGGGAGATTGGSAGGAGGEGGQAEIPGIAGIWAVHDGEKIERDDLTNPFQEGNTAWDGKTIRLFGARNEVLAFQVVLETDEKGASGVDVKLPALKQAGGNATIAYAPPGADPTAYAGRPIEIFTENYMFVPKASEARWAYQPGSAAAPAHPTGWKPVQLVPENAKAGKGGLPIDIAPRSNQAIWIEVYTARDLPAGRYTGDVEVTSGGQVQKVPVELELFDFDLPDENSLDVMLYFDEEQVSLYTGMDLEDRFHRFAHRQRVELVGAYTTSSLEEAAGRFDGSDFGPSAGYDGPGKGVGNRIAPATFYGPSPDYEQQDTAWAASDAWMTYLKDHLPDAITFLYMPDEPLFNEYRHIQSLASFVHGNPGPGRALPVFVTSSRKGVLDSAIDIWCSPPQRYDIATAEAERKAGHAYWFYNGHRPHTGALIIDTEATDSRATAWIAFKHGVEVYFNWHSVHWKHNFQKVGDKIQNVWADPVTFDNRGQPHKARADQGFLNGDGALIYPGREVLHPAEDRGIDGPVSTIQLANLRRGLQDHLYLTIAKKLGLESVVSKAISSVVPRVLSDAGPSVGFSLHGDDYENARRAIAAAIVAAK
jgi:hypothetical protein